MSSLTDKQKIFTEIRVTLILKVIIGSFNKTLVYCKLEPSYASADMMSVSP